MPRPLARSSWLQAAAASAVLFAGWSVLAVRSSAGQSADASASARLQTLAPGAADAASAIREGVPALLAVACLVLGALALTRRRYRCVGAAAVVVAVSNLASPAVRSLLDRPDLGPYGLAQNTLPSGHATAAASLAAAVLILWPVARRPWVVTAAAIVTVVACLASVFSLSHRLSDVVASALLVGAVTCAAMAALRPEPADRTVHRKAGAGPAPGGVMARDGSAAGRRAPGDDGVVGRHGRPVNVGEHTGGGPAAEGARPTRMGRPAA